MPEPKYSFLVLDSFALLAFFGDEPGGTQVRELLTSAAAGECDLLMSMVNLGEVMYIVERHRGLAQAQKTLARIDELPIEIVDTDRGSALAAAHIKAHCSLSYADCFAAALAQSRGAALVTGDPEFREAAIGKELPILWLG